MAETKKSRTVKKRVATRSKRKSRVSSAAKRTKKTAGRRRVLPRKHIEHILERFPGNPIIQPNAENQWESKATFNPAALHDKGKIHIVYRAIGDNDVSVLGYATSTDGTNIEERLPHPIYAKKVSAADNSERCLRDLQSPIFYISGGGWNGGCEDPRLTRIGDTVYMLYTAFDGWGSLRIALTSIKTNDFRNRIWKWKEPVLISPPGEIHKNWVIFPEKINGKFAILHSISPKIMIDYFDGLDDLDNGIFIRSRYGGEMRKNKWDSHPRGAGPPPIKTGYGWLLLYHAIDHKDPGKYKLGAMILDLKDPTKILYRSKKPVLEPDEYYENEGFKAGVIYSCGAVVVNGRLIVYYGGADSVSCVATAKLDEFLKGLISDKEPKLTRLQRLKS